MFPLLVHCSDVLNCDEETLLQMMSSAWQQKYQSMPSIGFGGNRGMPVSPFVAVFILESRLAVVWLKTRDAAEQIMGPQSQSAIWIVPRSRMTFRFSTLLAPTNFQQQGEQLTSIVEISKAVVDDMSIDLLNDWRMLVQPVGSYCDPRDISVTGSRVLIRFGSVELAKRSAWQLNEYLMHIGNKGMNAMGFNSKQPQLPSSSQFMVRIIPVNDLKVVSTLVQGSLTLFDIVKQIQQYHNCSLLQYLEDFLRQSASAGMRGTLPSNDSPIVLSLSYVSSPAPSKGPGPMNVPVGVEEQVYLVCPSAQDSRAIEIQSFLQLLPQARLCVQPPAPASTQFQDMRPPFSINNTNNFGGTSHGGPMPPMGGHSMHGGPIRPPAQQQMYPSMAPTPASNYGRPMGGGQGGYGNQNQMRNYRGGPNMGNMNMGGMGRDNMNNMNNMNIGNNVNNANMGARPFILWDMISCRLPDDNKLLLLSGGGAVGDLATSNAIAEAESKIVDYLKSLISSRNVVPIPVIVFVSRDQANNYPLDALTSTQGCKLILVPNSNSEVKGIENAMRSELDSILPGLAYSGAKASLLLCTSPYICDPLLTAMMRALAGHEITVVYGDAVANHSMHFSHPLVNTAMPWTSVLSTVLGSMPSNSLAPLSDSNDSLISSSWNQGSTGFLAPLGGGDSFLGESKSSSGASGLFKSSNGIMSDHPATSFLDDDLQSAINSDFLGGSVGGSKSFLMDDSVSVSGTTVSGLSFGGNNNLNGSSSTNTTPFGGNASAFESNTWNSRSAASPSTASSFMQGTTDSANSSVPEYSAQIELPSAAIVDFIEKSIQWAASSPDATAMISCRYLYGEDTNGYDHASICQVTIEKVHGKTCLMIRGKASGMVDLRKQRVQSLLQEVSRNQQYCSLPNTWSKNHRHALQGSEMMDLYEEEFKVSVSFQTVSHNNNTLITSANSTNQREMLMAYFLSSQVHQIAVFMRILQDMTPKEAVWRLPANSSPTAMMFAGSSKENGAVESFHLKYAVKLDVIPPNNQSSLLTVYAWGFDDMLEKVSAQLTGTSSGTGVLTSQPSIGPPPGLTVTPPSRPNNEGPSGSNFSVSSSTVSSGGERNGIVNSVASATSEQIKRLHRGSYSFADREAGIFFFAFEQQFRDYLEKAFSVLIDDTAVETNNGNNNPSNNNQQTNSFQSFFGNDGFDFPGANGNKNVILKISFYGNSASNVTAARAYLEQLNTTNLARVQLFLPQVSAKKYKEIHNKKIAQFTQLNNLRLQDLANASGGSLGMNYHPHHSQLIVDPLHQRGFVNIRMKPPMNSQGIRKMSFPSDVTVTICGSILVDSNKELLKEVEAAFNSIPSDYFFVSVSIPYTHPLKKRLTVKTSREEIVSRYGLVALKWEEACRATGNTGTAKVWALNQDSLDALLDEIRQAEILEPSLLQGPDGSSQGISVRYSPRSFFESAFAAAAAAAANPTALTMIDGNGVEFSATGTISADGIVVEGKDGSTKTGDGESPPQQILGKVVVGLPDLTLRYVLLAPPMHTDIRLLLQRWTETPCAPGFGIKVKYPYRDRNDPNAAVLFEGEKDMISQAAKEVNNMIQSAAKNLRSVQVTMSEEQNRFLISNDLALVKQIQGQAGIHLKLDPTLYELDAAKCLFDMRFVVLNKIAARRANFGLDLNIDNSENGWSDFITAEALVSTEVSSGPTAARVAIFDKKMSELNVSIRQKSLDLHGIVLILCPDMMTETDNKECLESGQCVVDTVEMKDEKDETVSKQVIKLLLTSGQQQAVAESTAAVTIPAVPADDSSVDSTGVSSASSATSSVGHNHANTVTATSALVQNELRALIVKGLRQCQDLGMTNVCVVLPSSIVAENFTDPIVAPSPYHGHAAGGNSQNGIHSSASSLLRQSVAETVIDFCKSSVSRPQMPPQTNVVVMLSDDCDSPALLPIKQENKEQTDNEIVVTTAESMSDSSSSDAAAAIVTAEKFRKVLDAMQSTSTVITGSSALAIALLKVSFPQITQQKQQGSNYYGNQSRLPNAAMDQQKVNVIACNMTLPRTFYNQQGMQGNSGSSTNQRSGKSFLVKGLPQGIQAGLELLRKLLSTGTISGSPERTQSSSQQSQGGFPSY